MKKIIASIIIVILLISLGWLVNNFRAPSKSTEKERFVITQNETEEQAIDDLYTKGFLKNKKIFNLIIKLRGWQKKLEPGGYMISKGMNAYQLAGTFAFGPYQKWVVILPGKRKEQVALTLQKTLGWNGNVLGDFIEVANEGYLYPDTYLIDVNSEPQIIVQKLLNNFNEKFDAQLQKDLLDQNIRNDTAVKIASLIERESGGPEDKPIIAGIIWNRLNKKMRLEIDATVQYAITSSKFKVQSSKLDDDFVFWPTLGPGIVRTVDSPYNTYLNDGLSPGPICSPSIDSIRAVAYPVETDALYYLHSPDKQIHTAKTYKEHLENIEKYLQ